MLDEAKELVLKSDFSKALALLEELQRQQIENSLEVFEIVSLQFIIQRRMRNYSVLPIYVKKLKDLFSAINIEYLVIKKICTMLSNFIEKKATHKSLYEFISRQSSKIKIKIPLILYHIIRFSDKQQATFLFPVKYGDLKHLHPIFNDFDDLIYYPELLISTTWSHLYRWENKIALESASEYMRISEEISDFYGITISLGTIASIYADMGNCKEAIDYSFRYLEHARKLGIINIIWHAYFAIALHYAVGDDLKNALIYDTKASELEQHPDFNDTTFAPTRKLITVHINLKKGDVNLALNQMLEMLEKYRDHYNPYSLAMAYGVLADIYTQRSDLDSALEYYLKGLEIREKFGGYSILANNYFHLFEVNLNLGVKDKALEYLEKLRKLKGETDEILVNNLCNFSEALYLKSNDDVENRNKAKRILVDLIATETPYHKTANQSYLHLCDLMLNEIKSTGDMSLVQTLHNYIKELTLKATLVQSNLLLVQLYFLQSKILLLDLKVEESISLLERAINLARDKGLTRLEILLSNEYDLLLHQLDQWEEFSTYLPTLDEKFELTHIESLVSKMLRKWVTYSDVVQENESPQYFLILDQEGSIIFTETFSSSVFESASVSAILSKIKQLKEKLKTDKSFVRFRYRQYSSLLSRDRDLLFCYIFMGKSYVPMNKFSNFFQHFNNSSISNDVHQQWLSDDKIDLNSRVILSSLIEKTFL